MWPDNNYRRLENVTPEQCAQQCIDGVFPGCASFRYKVEHKKCDLLAIVPDDTDNVLAASTQGWNFYLVQPDYDALQASVEEMSENLKAKEAVIAEAAAEYKEEIAELNRIRNESLAIQAAQHQQYQAKAEEKMDQQAEEISNILLKHKAELAKLEASLIEKTDEISLQSIQHDAALEEIQQKLARKSEDLQSLNDKYNETVAGLQSEISRKADAIENLVSEHETEIDRLQQSHSSASEVQAEKHLSEISGLEENLSKVNKKMEAQSEQHKVQLASMNKTLHEKSNKMASLVEQHASHTKVLNQRFSQEKKELNSQHDKCKREVSQLNAALRKKSREAKSLSSQHSKKVSVLSKALSKTAYEIKDLKSERKQVDSKLATCKTLLTEEVKKAEILRSKEKSLATQLADLTSELKEARDSIPVKRPRHCMEIYKDGQKADGVYQIYPFGPKGRQLNVSCVAGWTVFQQRDNRQKVPENFDRNWADYKKGFGKAGQEFWLGLDALYALTSAESMKMRAEVIYDYRYYPRTVYYSRFRMSPESSNFRLSLGGFKGTQLANYFGYANGASFSTPDADHSTNRRCSRENRGGWWFRSSWSYCRTENLNAPSRKDIKWSGYGRDLCLWTRMAIRPN